MVARRALRFLRRRFNETSIAVAQAKASSRRSGKRKIDAKFYPAFLKGKRSALRSQFLSGTKMLDLKITARLQANFALPTPITLTRPNTEFETGRAAVAPRHAKQLVGSRRVQLRRRFCQRSMQISRSSRT